MGRDSLLTEQVEQKIVQAIIGGAHFEIACRYAGIAPRTGYDWMARGEGRARARPANTPFVHFVQAVRDAEAQLEVIVIAQVRKGVPDNPNLGLNFLARRFPDRWANREKIDVGGTGKEIVFRVTYGNPSERAAGVDGPVTPTAPEAGSLPSQ